MHAAASGSWGLGGVDAPMDLRIYQQKDKSEGPER